MIKNQTKCPLDNCYSLVRKRSEQVSHPISHVERSNYITGFRFQGLQDNYGTALELH